MKKAAPTPAPYTYFGAFAYITSIKYANTTIKLPIASRTISLKGLNSFFKGKPKTVFFEIVSKITSGKAIFIIAAANNAPIIYAIHNAKPV